MKNQAYSFILLFLTLSCKSGVPGGEIKCINVTYHLNEKQDDPISIKTLQVLKSRIDDYYGSNYSITNTLKSIQIKFYDKIDTSVLKELLQTRGRFGIWQTYNINEIHQFLDTINLQVINLKLESRFIGDTSKTVIRSPLKFPFYCKLIPILDEEGYFTDGPYAGMAESSDTSLIDSVFRLKQITDKIVRTLRFKWFILPKRGYYPLISINNLGKETAQITTEMIKKTSINTGTGDNNYLLIELRKENSRNLELLSKDNIDRTLAITIDNHVYSLERQTNTCDNGLIKLHGYYNPDKLKLLASILQYGELPSIPIIDRIEVVKK